MLFQHTMINTWTRVNSAAYHTYSKMLTTSVATKGYLIQYSVVPILQKPCYTFMKQLKIANYIYIVST